MRIKKSIPINNIFINIYYLQLQLLVQLCTDGFSNFSALKFATLNASVTNQQIDRDYR